MLSFLKILAYLIAATALLFVMATPGENKSAPPVTISTKEQTKQNIEATEEPKAPEPVPVPLPKPLPTAVKMPTLPSLPPQPPPEPPPASLLPLPEPSQPRIVNWDEINKKTRVALVNIICTTLRSGSFNPVSGSGVIIDRRGVILTNAHVAQYFLLKDYLVPNFVECLIRTGEPARNRYKAELLYIAPQWIERNYQKIRIGEATGTGENDFALLLITESVNQSVSPLPDSYPSLLLDTSDKALQEKGAVLVAGYAAGFLSGINIQKELYPVSSVAEFSDIYSFKENTPDLLSVKGSTLAQQGASGGAVVSNEGKLIGLISTASVGATTGERELHAITGAHLERSFAERNISSIQEMLAETGLARLAGEFNKNIAPQLTALLENALQKKD